MSDIQKIVRFEILPNEIILECFEYLNALDIFHSFNQLNYRFNQLVQTISIHFNFQHIRKSIFDKFCSTIILNPHIKNQIYSLYLSDKDDCGQTELFLSFFSINEFVHLKSLTLNEVNKHNTPKIKPMLLLLTELCSLHIIQTEYVEYNILVGLPMAKLQILSLPSVHHLSRALNNEISSIKQLTLSSCSSTELNDILKYMSMLEYLNIQRLYMYGKSVDNISSHKNYYAIHLKQLIIMQFRSGFKELELLLKQTPNLRNLTISAMRNLEIFDAGRWEYLIKSTLPHLNTFNFEFSLSNWIINGSFFTDDSVFVEKFKRFQSDFWREEHRWYTEYIFEKRFINIYSIPYMSKTYELKPNIHRKYDRLPTNSTFINVTDLTLPNDLINEKCYYYFSNVTSLTIDSGRSSSVVDNRILKREHIPFLKTIVNLSNVKHFDLALESQIVSSEVLLEILKEAPQLSSMAIDPDQLISICDDDELCIYLNKMIKKLDLYGYSPVILKNVIKICEIFSNLDYLKCTIDEQDNILYLINHLPKLSILDVV